MIDVNTHTHTHTHISTLSMDVMCDWTWLFFQNSFIQAECQMYNSAREQGKAYSSHYLPSPTHHHCTPVPIKHPKKTGWVIIEKLISRWHASVGLAVRQMGIVRVTLIHPGKPTSTQSTIKKLWAVEWTWHCVFILMLHVADRSFLRESISEKKWLQVIITQNVFQIKKKEIEIHPVTPNLNE